jgi:hypothetical protein
MKLGVFHVPQIPQLRLRRIVHGAHTAQGRVHPKQLEIFF